MASLLLLVIYLTFISLMALALLAASAFRPNALQEAEGRARSEVARRRTLCTAGGSTRLGATQLEAPRIRTLCTAGGCARLDAVRDWSL
ncbi:Uncharacterised protein [Collinsella intestinalis]|nr:Uncharacterised protein [Collinsella intestinalis]